MVMASPAQESEGMDWSVCEDAKWRAVEMQSGIGKGTTVILTVRLWKRSRRLVKNIGLP
jgi:hypothetical protein